MLYATKERHAECCQGTLRYSSDFRFMGAWIQSWFCLYCLTTVFIVDSERR